MARAAARLRAGPAHTLELARDVLSIEGNAGAISAALFALLGEDARFRVDASGVWRLCEGGGTIGPSLQELRYAVVDVETTGGAYGSGHRITEVAIVEVRGGVIEEEFSTLVNPGRPIPRWITELTGIDDALVRGAPYFDDVAQGILERLEGRVFVAHNARFDWGFVSAQLADAVGQVPEIDRLCTVRLSRRLLPRLRRRNLDAVADYFGIEVDDRHRALGDARATARVLLRLLDEASLRGLVDLEALEVRR